MKFGTLYSYWGNEWKCDYMKTAEKMKAAGCDIMEIGAGHLLDMTDSQIGELKSKAEDLGLILTSNIGPAKKYDVASRDPEVRKAGIEYLCNIMKQMDKLNSRRIVGVMYTYWPNDFTDTDKEFAWAKGVESVKTMGKVAEDLGIEFCLEVVNRFETYVLNTCEEGLQFCKEVDIPSVKLLLDTFHMNIEEDNIPDALRAAGKYLGQLHVGEGNRKLPGQGSLPWGEIGQALRDIDFQGGIVAEPFYFPGGAVGRDIKVFRDLSRGADEKKMDEMLAESMRYLRSQFLA